MDNTALLIRRELDEFFGILSELEDQSGFTFVQKSPDEWQPNLRMDWAVDGEHPRLNDVLLAKLKEAMVMDIYDVVANGDVDMVADPLLKTLDGEKKRGQRLKDMILHSASMYLKYSEKKNETEVTVYVQPHLFWD